MNRKASSSTDVVTASAKESLEDTKSEKIQNIHTLDEELEKSETELNKSFEASRILNSLIKPYAQKTFWFMCGYCAFVGITIWLNGFGLFKNKIADSVLNRRP